MRSYIAAVTKGEPRERKLVILSVHRLRFHAWYILHCVSVKAMFAVSNDRSVKMTMQRPS